MHQDFVMLRLSHLSELTTFYTPLDMWCPIKQLSDLFSSQGITRTETTGEQLQILLLQWQIKPNTFSVFCYIKRWSPFKCVPVKSLLPVCVKLVQLLRCLRLSLKKTNKAYKNDSQNDSFYKRNITALPSGQHCYDMNHGVCKLPVSRNLIAYSTLKTHGCPNPTLKLQQR